MEVRPGYKKTEVGVIPEEWEVKTLSTICTEISDGIHTTPTYVTYSEFYFINGNNLVNDRIVITDNTMCVSELEYRKLRKDLTDKTIPFSINGTIGNLAFYKSEPVVLGKSAAYINIRKNVSETFVAYCLKHRPTILYFENELTGTTIRNLSLQSLRNTPLPFPPTSDEECAISSALKDVDALLNALEQLIAKKRDLKQAAMQQLLTGQTRLPGFSGKWEVRRLGEVGAFLKGRGVKKDDAQTGDLPCIRYGEIYTHHNDHIRQFSSWISPRVAATATRIIRGDLLFAGSGETKEEIGKCAAFIDDCEAYAGGDIVILRSVDLNPVFMGYLCNTKPVNVQKASKGQGDAVVHIGATALASIHVDLPPLPEQTDIAAVLSDMDAEIEALEQRLAKTRDVKRAMMQELLTGRIRLVPPEARHG